VSEAERCPECKRPRGRGMLDCGKHLAKYPGDEYLVTDCLQEQVSALQAERDLLASELARD